MGKHAMSWQESADFLEAAEGQGERAHAIACLVGLHGLTVESVCDVTVEDLGDDGDQRTLAVRILDGTRRFPLPLTVRTARALEVYVGSRRTGPLLLDDDGGPLPASAALRIINSVARSAGLGARLDRRTTY